MDNIKISLQEVNDIANELRMINSNMYEALSRAKKEMNDLRIVWESDSSTTLRERFNMFANKFENCQETIEQYAKFLDLTSQSYDNIESTIDTNAQSFE